MIGSLRGRLLHRGAGEVVVEVGGLGYVIVVSPTTVVALGAIMAARHGIVVCNAMGNEGGAAGSLWSPADAESIHQVAQGNYDRHPEAPPGCGRASAIHHHTPNVSRMIEHGAMLSIELVAE